MSWMITVGHQMSFRSGAIRSIGVREFAATTTAVILRDLAAATSGEWLRAEGITIAVGSRMVGGGLSISRVTVSTPDCSGTAILMVADFLRPIDSSGVRLGTVEEIIFPPFPGFGRVFYRAYHSPSPVMRQWLSRIQTHLVFFEEASCLLVAGHFGSGGNPP
ncbi:homoserine O-acetyltransferase [Striga asiatica]|uniref:Homoserine O-acetyltransferase n=1 Tax=Striga asiatica TaxID=4170 RepID=A0A5A7PSJ1_STRAF|nr:homoserine O-acetyltransferase [Striga asiatica]